MSPTPPIILASTSSYRRQLLERLCLPFEALSPAVDETLLPGEAPSARALRLARAKAAAVAAQYPGSIVIGSDQVASLGEGLEARVLRKPGDRATCRTQLVAMSGRVARFDTAVAVRLGPTELWHADTTLVSLRDLDAAAIDRYMDLEPAFDCAGGFKCEGLGVSLLRTIETRDPTALVGLPLIGLCGLLRGLGVQV